jgi:hypothetical protein
MSTSPSLLGSPDDAAQAAMNPPDNNASSNFSVVPADSSASQPTTSPTATPSYPDSPDQNPAMNPVASDDNTAAAPAKHSLFRNILIGALSGIKSHLEGAAEGALVGGLPGAIVGAASPKMADNALKARQSMSNSEVQTAKYQAQNAQEQLAINQTHLMELQREYSMLPKTQQESFDRAHEAELRNQYNTLVDAGNAAPIQNFGNWEDPNAWAAFQTLHSKYIAYGTPSPFNYVPSVNPQGDLVMLKVHDPNQGLHEAQTITTNQTKPDGSPITITVPAGTPWATYQGLVLQSQLDDIKSQRKINESSATGATAKNEATANKSNAQASNAGNSTKTPDLVVGSMPDGTQVAGTPQELSAAGVAHFTKLPASESAKVTVARQLISPGGEFQNVAADLAALKKSGELGAIASRWNNFLTNKLGTGAPKTYVDLATHLSLLQTALMQAHVGSRGGNEMLEHFKQTVGDPSITDANTLLARLSASYNYVQHKAMLVPQKGSK